MYKRKISIFLKNIYKLFLFLFLIYMYVHIYNHVNIINKFSFKKEISITLFEKSVFQIISFLCVVLTLIFTMVYYIPNLNEFILFCNCHYQNLYFSFYTLFDFV